MNGRTALGACLVLLPVLAGAIFLDCAQRLVPVYAAARDLAAGVPLSNGDLMVSESACPPQPYVSTSCRLLAGR
jgi:hypothetical protein